MKIQSAYRKESAVPCARLDAQSQLNNPFKCCSCLRVIAYDCANMCSSNHYCCKNNYSYRNIILCHHSHHLPYRYHHNQSITPSPSSSLCSPASWAVRPSPVCRAADEEFMFTADAIQRSASLYSPMRDSSTPASH